MHQMAPGLPPRNYHLSTMLAVLFVCGSCTALKPDSPVVSDIASVIIYVSETGQIVRADYRDDDTVILIFPDGKTKILQLAVSASGARFTSGAAEWWEHQGEATYRENDQLIFSGKQQQK